MGNSSNYKVIIAENAPLLSSGLAQVIRKIPALRAEIIIASSEFKLLEYIAQEFTDILIINPGFGGLIHPETIRKSSLNSAIRLLAIEIGKLSKETLALYDDHIHVTDDFSTLSAKIFPPENERSHPQKEKDQLSSREKEIVSLVVKGFTNQEIADKLFLSVHTVITHRRNIAKKLEIHSATGLTIYAIVNKIVDLSEIKI